LEQSVLSKDEEYYSLADENSFHFSSDEDEDEEPETLIK
jgi:hypothetical protein